MTRAFKKTPVTRIFKSQYYAGQMLIEKFWDCMSAVPNRKGYLIALVLAIHLKLSSRSLAIWYSDIVTMCIWDQADMNLLVLLFVMTAENGLLGKVPWGTNCTNTVFCRAEDYISKVSL